MCTPVPTPLGVYVAEQLAAPPVPDNVQVAGTNEPGPPLLVKSTRAALESVDRNYERAARNLGASEWKLFWRVTLPLARRSILAATALAFARSLGDFGVTLMVAGNIPGRTQTVAVAIYDAVESGNGAVARVLVLVISAVALLILTLANRLSPSRI